jgi:hypothetical protein
MTQDILLLALARDQRHRAAKIPFHQGQGFFRGKFWLRAECPLHLSSGKQRRHFGRLSAALNRAGACGLYRRLGGAYETDAGRRLHEAKVEDRPMIASGKPKALVEVVTRHIPGATPRRRRPNQSALTTRSGFQSGQRCAPPRLPVAKFVLDTHGFVGRGPTREHK